MQSKSMRATTDPGHFANRLLYIKDIVILIRPMLQKNIAKAATTIFVVFITLRSHFKQFMNQIFRALDFVVEDIYGILITISNPERHKEHIFRN
nr:hypothetical transcript [Hymenolepis microstoma]